MPAIALQAQDFLGNFCYFAREGMTIGEQTVSETILPDTDSTDDWLNLGDITDFGFGRKTGSAPWNKLMPSGNLIEQQFEPVFSRWIDWTSQQMNAFEWELQFGLAEAIVPGTAQAPGTAADSFIRGWFYTQARILGTGHDRFRLLVWGEVRLVKDVTIAQKVIPSALRLYKINELVAESVVFPS